MRNNKNLCSYVRFSFSCLILLGYSGIVCAQSQVVSISSSSTTRVNSFHSESNYSEEETLLTAGIGTEEGIPYSERTYFKLDLSDIPSNAIIHHATLYLYGNEHAPVEEEFSALLLYPEEEWQASSLVWDNQPELPLESNITLIDASEESQDYSLDLTNRVRNLIYYPSIYIDYGYCLRLEEEEEYRKYTFHSQFTENSSLKPKLEIDYEIPIDLEYELVSIPIDDFEAENGYAGIKISQGNPPYTYQWSDGSSVIGNQNFISDQAVGTYYLTVNDNINRTFNFEIGIGYAPEWNDEETTYFTAYPNTIEKNDGWGWTQVVRSNDVLLPGEDAWVEYTVNEIKNRMIGFADNSDWQAGYTKLIGGLYLKEDRDLKRMQIDGDQTSIDSYDEGDILRIEKSGTTINYYKNGVLTGSTIDAQLNTKTLTLIAAVYKPNSRLQAVRSSFPRKMWLEFYVENTMKTGNEGDIFVFPKGGSAPYTYAWSHNAGNKDRSQDLPTGTYTVTVTDANGQSIIDNAVVYADPDETMNWRSTKSYDLNGNLLGASKAFSNYNGKPLQSQSISTKTLNMYASQPVYDDYSRPVISTLSAATFHNRLDYRNNFIRATDNLSYNYIHFDNENSAPLVYGDVDKPFKVDSTQKGELGWYYSANNNVIKRHDRTNYPYSRVEYAKYDPSQIVRSSAPHDQYRMGSGHESKSYTIPAAGELTYMFGYGGGWKLGKHYTITPNAGGNGVGTITKQLGYDTRAYKTISYSPNGKESVSFYDTDGKLIASCLSGRNDLGINENQFKSMSSIKGEAHGTFRYVDIHLPDGCESSLRLQKSRSSAHPLTLDIINLITGEVVMNACTLDAPSLPPGIYRIVDKTYITQPFLDDEQLIPDIHITYNVNYYNFSLNLFDKTGNVIAQVDPVGFDNSPQNTISVINRQHLLNIDPINSGSNWEFTTNTTPSPITSNSRTLKESVTPPQSGSIQFTNVKLTFNPPSSALMINNGDGTNQFAYDLTNVPESQVATVPMSQETEFNSDTSTYFPAGFISTGNGPIVDPSYQCGTGVFSPTFPSSSFCPGKTLVVYPISGGGGYCVSCKSSSSSCMPPKPYEFKYEFWFDINAIAPSGTTNVAYIPVEATLHKSYVGPMMQINWSFAFLNDPVEVVIGPGLSETTTEIEVKVSVKEIEPYHSAINDCHWTMREGYGYGTNSFLNTAHFEDLQVYFEVSTHTMGGIEHDINNLFTYNSIGELIRNKSEDAGKNEYVYTEDGLLRFSQSAQQRLDNKFSYTNYDLLGRPLEMGIANEVNPSDLKFQNHIGDIPLGLNDDKLTDASTLENISDLVDNTGIAIGTAYTNEETYIRYDKADAGYMALGSPFNTYKQNYLRGRVSHVWNDNSATWYSYFSDGRLEWIITNYYFLNGGTAKTVDYEYDELGQVSQVIYQKNNPTDYFEHQYAYDRVGNLQRVNTRTASTGMYVEEAEYKYDLSGQLERVEIGQNLQGIDYTYNVLGMLKSINSPNIGAVNHRAYFVDPGRDGANGFGQDIFGMSIDYFSGDYTRADQKMKPNPSQNNYFDGKIAAIRWNTNAGSMMASADYQNVYEYSYNRKGWLKSALYTTVGPYGNNSVTPAMQSTSFGSYGVNGISYDMNGNIQTLTRRGNSSTNLNMDQFTYRYDQAKPNRLVHLNDISSVYTTDLDDQGVWNPSVSSSWNYDYDAEGRLTWDKAEQLKYYYNAYGLVERIEKNHGSGYVNLVSFDYGNDGLRNRKISYNNSGTAIGKTWYIRDASGAEVAKYEESVGGSVGAPTYPLLADARLGEYDRPDDSRIYEFMDHLGNVRATFSRDATNGISINSYADYYPFGSPLPGRQLIAGDRYEHGYQGQFTERDEETGLDAFELRMWDSRLARWHSTDPYGQFHSPYLGMGNNPVSGVDPDGGFVDKLIGVGVASAFVKGGISFGVALGVNAALSGIDGYLNANKSFDAASDRASESMSQTNFTNSTSLGIGGGGPIGPLTSNAIKTPAYQAQFGTGFKPGAFEIDLNWGSFARVLSKRAIPIISAVDLLSRLKTNDFRLMNMDEPTGKLSRVSDGEMKALEKKGFDSHDYKPSGQGKGPKKRGKIDIWKDRRGNLFFRAEGGKHYEPLYENINVILGY